MILPHLHRSAYIKRFTRLLSASSRNRVVIVGAGWSGYRLAHDLDKSKFDVKLVSPRNHYLFTPLLPSTAVGTLEFRAIQEPVRSIPNLEYFQANVTDVNIETSEIECKDIFKYEHTFKMKYDALILAPGCETNTFGVKGVEHNNYDIFFLKQLQHARGIRNRLIDCFERASSPGIEDKDIERLLTFVIVGGGPTNVEFAAELYDFLKEDVSRWYPELHKRAKVVVVEATGHILGQFHETLVSYVEGLFARRKIHMRMNTAVKEVNGHTATLTNGETLDFGMMVWSTGLKQVPLVEKLAKSGKFASAKNGRLLMDGNLHILKPNAPGYDGPMQPVAGGAVLAMGDCCGDETKPLPPLAQVASQQGIYLAAKLNKYGLKGVVDGTCPPFKYQHLGSMASVGEWKGVVDTSMVDILSPPSVKGILAFLLWRAAYWTRQVSLQNKILIPMYWFKSMLFGRDISRF